MTFPIGPWFVWSPALLFEDVDFDQVTRVTHGRAQRYFTNHKRYFTNPIDNIFNIKEECILLVAQILLSFL